MFPPGIRRKPLQNAAGAAVQKKVLRPRYSASGELTAKGDCRIRTDLRDSFEMSGFAPTFLLAKNLTNTPILLDKLPSCVIIKG